MGRRRAIGLSKYLALGAAVLVTAASSMAAATPRKIYPMHDPSRVAPEVSHSPFAGANSCTMTYYGGPVISNVHIVPVFWGSAVDSTVQTWAAGYLGTLANSAYLDLLSEYSTLGKTGTALAGYGPGGTTGQTITRGDATAGIVITPSTGATGTIDDTAIGPELLAQIKSGALPPPTYDAQGYPNTLYFLFFAPGVTINQGGTGSCSSNGFCGYHGSTAYTPPSGQAGTYISYAVIPDMGTASGCHTGCAAPSFTNDTDIMVGTVSHELSEAVTDVSDSATGWYNTTGDKGSTATCTVTTPSTASAGGGEIGDVCADANGKNDDTETVPQTSIRAQHTWSNVLDGCFVANSSTAPIPDPIDGGTVVVPPQVDSGVTPSGDAGGGSHTDAGQISGQDGGTHATDAGTPPLSTDGGTGTSDAGPTPAPHNGGSGCSCSTVKGGAPGRFGGAGLALGLALFARAVRRRRQ